MTLLEVIRYIETTEHGLDRKNDVSFFRFERSSIYSSVSVNLEFYKRGIGRNPWSTKSVNGRVSYEKYGGIKTKK